jgi:elongation factor Tu
LNPPNHHADKPFLFPIDDVFSIKGRGTIVTGRVVRGTLRKGKELDIIGLRNETIKKVVGGIEMFHRELESIQAGDNAGILLRATDRDEVRRGMVLAEVGSIRPHKQFKCEVSMLRRDEGGRHQAFFSGYRPGFHIYTADIPGTVTLINGVEMVKPGDTVKFVVNLVTPVAMEPGTFFSILEGDLKVGSGHVIQLLD